MFQLYACGEGTNGRLGLGHNNNVSLPRPVPFLNQYVIKKVAVHSGGKHAMALTLDGKVNLTVLKLDLAVLHILKLFLGIFLGGRRRW